ncbi:MAG: hypothetical protein PUF78_00630 [Lachnospiraceae bacterium]|nr:hypothetical protein [Lachnospiraceae bacterium]
MGSVFVAFVFVAFVFVAFVFVAFVFVGFDTQHLFGVTGEKNGVSHDSALRRNYLNKKQFLKIR